MQEVMLDGPRMERTTDSSPRILPMAAAIMSAAAVQDSAVAASVAADSMAEAGSLAEAFMAAEAASMVAAVDIAKQSYDVHEPG
jgi:hypothetical protein